MGELGDVEFGDEWLCILGCTEREVVSSLFTNISFV